MKRYLVLYWFPTDQQMRPAVREHMRALEDGRERIVYHNSYSDPAREVRGLEWDGIVLHTTFLCERWSDRFPGHRERYRWVADVSCPKVAIPQDDYDHSEVLDEWLAELNVSEIFSVFGPEPRRILYPTLHDRVPFRHVLTGYIDESLAQQAAARGRPIADRPVDIVYRAAKLPYWFGSHGQLKHRIAGVVEGRAHEHGLRTDISTRWEDTVFGGAWVDFLLSGRVVIGAESGSSVLDRRGETQRKIRAILDERPAATFEEVDAEMPPGWDDWEFFALSPRHLEAVVTRTAQVLVEGDYSGVLQAGRHYVPLRRDFSNLDDVLEQIRDHDLLRQVTDCAYDEVYLHGGNRMSDFAAEIRDVFEHAEAKPNPLRKALFPVARAGKRAAAAPESVPRVLRRKLPQLARTLVGRLRRH